MKERFFIRINLIATLVFLIIFVIILYYVDPFEIGSFLLVVFYIVLFGLIWGILNLIGTPLKIPFWVRILIALTIVIILILKRH
jgi:hypothetical protein